jgi:hypothetical protein
MSEPVTSFMEHLHGVLSELNGREMTSETRAMVVGRVNRVVEMYAARVQHALRDYQSIPDDPLESPLPCDIWVGNTVFTKGVHLRAFLDAAAHFVGEEIEL